MTLTFPRARAQIYDFLGWLFFHSFRVAMTVCRCVSISGAGKDDDVGDYEDDSADEGVRLSVSVTVRDVGGKTRETSMAW